jgi:hypothetical protein
MDTIYITHTPAEIDYKENLLVYYYNFWRFFSILNIAFAYFSIQLIYEIKSLSNLKADWAVYFFLALFLITALTFFVMYIINPIRVVNLVKKKHLVLHPTTYGINESRIEVKGESTERVIEWNNIHKCVETKKSYCLINLNKNLDQVLIPKRCFTSHEQIIIFKGIIAQKNIILQNISFDFRTNSIFTLKTLIIILAFIFSFIVLCGYPIYISINT